MKKISLFVFVLLSVTDYAQQNMDTVTIRPTKLKDNIYILMGAGGNLGLLTGPDGSLLIDDQFAPLSDKIKAAVQKSGGSPVKYLINTHLHGDHTGGNENFKKDGTTIVAQENVRNRMMKPTTNRQGQTTPPRDPAAWPLVTFTETVQLHLNGEDVEIMHFKQKAHTDGDAIVHFVKANVFHTGDLFVRYGYPYIDITNGGSFKGFLASLDKIIEVTNDQSIIIPGHGLPATRADVRALRDKLADIGNQVKAALTIGKKVEEIPAMDLTKDYEAELGKGFLKGKDFVLLIAQEFSGK